MSEREYEKDILTHRKGRLLSYLVYFSRIRNKPSVSGELLERLGYKSPGHWHHDINDLIDKGYIVDDKEQGYYTPSDKAKEMLSPITHLKSLANHNWIAAIVIFIVGFTNLVNDQLLWFILLFLVSIYLCIVNLLMIGPLRHLLLKRKPLT